MSKKNVFVAQSGGPTVAINASLAGVLHSAIESDKYDTVYGSKYGILGILKDQLIDLTKQSQDIPDLLIH